MSATEPVRPRNHRVRDVIATIAVGVTIVAAALIPAITANSGGTTTVSGDVTLNGRPLAFFPVGFWTTSSNEVVSSTTTDANGGFTLDVSDTLDGYAYAGTTPDATHAIMEADGQQVVRGVMNGAKTISPLYQNRATATAKALYGGASTVHFRLQSAGRIAGTSPVAAGALRAIQIRRADNSVVQTLALDSKSRFSSMLLTPGQYGVALIPKSPGLPTVANAVVTSGRTTTVRLARPVTGATVLGQVTTGTAAVGAGIPVLLQQDGAVVASTTTAADGDWSFAGIAAGDYSVEVGLFDEPDSMSASTSASSVDVQIPGASPTPTSTTPTASPSASETATTPQTAAVEPVQRTADAVLPKSFAVTVPEALGEVGVATPVDRAGRLTGYVTVAGASDASNVQVVVEEASTQAVVRVTTAAADGRYDVGGLQPGTRYRVYAVTRPTDPTQAQMGHATAVARTTAALADMIVDEPALTLSGTVASATNGRVVVGDSSLAQRTSSIDESGAYAVQGLVPGAFPVVVTTAKREASEPVGVVVSAAQPVVDLQPGPQSATFIGWFINGGAGVPIVTGTATDANGATVTFGPNTNEGHVAIADLTPGTYTYDEDSFRGTVPTVDGPWYYTAPTGQFTLSDGAKVDFGPILLHVRTH